MFPVTVELSHQKAALILLYMDILYLCGGEGDMCTLGVCRTLWHALGDLMAC